MESGKIITIFGSSRARHRGTTYKRAYLLGKLLAESGFVVCNGGYSGTMEASAQGAKEAGGRTIGIATKIFEEKHQNQWVDEKIHTETYLERIDKLLNIADAFVVLKGGVGTLSELSIAWCLSVIKEMRKPIILIGKEWQRVINSFGRHLIMDRYERSALNIVKTPEDAVELLKKLLK